MFHRCSSKLDALVGRILPSKSCRYGSRKHNSSRVFLPTQLILMGEGSRAAADRRALRYKDHSSHKKQGMFVRAHDSTRIVHPRRGYCGGRIALFTKGLLRLLGRWGGGVTRAENITCFRRKSFVETRCRKGKPNRFLTAASDCTFGDYRFALYYVHSCHFDQMARTVLL